MMFQKKHQKKLQKKWFFWFFPIKIFLLVYNCFMVSFLFQVVSDLKTVNFMLAHLRDSEVSACFGWKGISSMLGATRTYPVTNRRQMLVCVSCL